MNQIQIADKKSDSTWTLTTEKAQKFILAGLLLAAGAVGFYLTKFHSFEVGGPGDWGVFGDYIGGVVGSIFAYLSFMVLVMTLLTQQQELRLTRGQIKNEVAARHEQIGIIQKNAKLERWSRVAEQLSERLDWYQENPDARNQRRGYEEGKKNYQLLRGSDAHVNVSKAFDVNQEIYSRVIHYSEMSPNQREGLETSSLGSFIQLATNLNRICRAAEAIDPLARLEFSDFYARHSRQFEGLVRKGYLQAPNVNCFVDRKLKEDPITDN